MAVDRLMMIYDLLKLETVFFVVIIFVVIIFVVVFVVIIFVVILKYGILQMKHLADSRGQ